MTRDNIISIIIAIGLIVSVLTLHPVGRKILKTFFSALTYPLTIPKRILENNKTIEFLRAENKKLRAENEQLFEENLSMGLKPTQKAVNAGGSYSPTLYYERKLKALEDTNAALKRERDELLHRVNSYVANVGLSPSVGTIKDSGFFPKDSEYEELVNRKKELVRAINDYNLQLNRLTNDNLSLLDETRQYQATLEELRKAAMKEQKRYNACVNNIEAAKEVLKAVQFAITETRTSGKLVDIGGVPLSELDAMFPPIRQRLNSMECGELKKALQLNRKQMLDVTDDYVKGIEFPANQVLCKTVSFALIAELNVLLRDVSYGKLEESTRKLNDAVEKYQSIMLSGMYQAHPTLLRFVGEMEYLMLNAVSIEYAYYEKRERIRQEQLSIKEQIRQEKAEKAALEVERRKIEAEEAKFVAQIAELRSRVADDPNPDTKYLNRIAELEEQLSLIITKKDDIITLQNGKAGNVYIISNYGTFGENVFKIGMTRRLEPQDRIDELSSASVPFKFDVHSFIFSEDAVALEAEMHRRLESRRVNCVNLRKEFFYATIDELEAITHEIAPTADFQRTMFAEEYYQSESLRNKLNSERKDVSR